MRRFKPVGFSLGLLVLCAFANAQNITTQPNNGIHARAPSSRNASRISRLKIRASFAA